MRCCSASGAGAMRPPRGGAWRRRRRVGLGPVRRRWGRRWAGVSGWPWPHQCGGWPAYPTISATCSSRNGGPEIEHRGEARAPSTRSRSSAIFAAGPMRATSSMSGGGHRLDGVVLAAVEVGVLDVVAGALVAEAAEHVEVEVDVAGAHAADVEGVHRSQEVGAALDVVADDRRARRSVTSKSSGVCRAPARAKPSARRGPVVRRRTSARRRSAASRRRSRRPGRRSSGPRRRGGSGCRRAAA